jgi:hypothetical protein
MAKVEEFRDRIPPEVEQRVEQAVSTFRENHKHPANLALHAVGYYAILKGIARFLRHKRFRGAGLIAFGVGMLFTGHNIEGTEPFSVLKNFGNGRAS